MFRSDRRTHGGSRAAPDGPPRAAAHEAQPSRAGATTLALLPAGTAGRIVRIHRDLTGRAERLAALGVTVGARIRVLQTFPGIVFECDQTELAVERSVGGGIVVSVEE